MLALHLLQSALVHVNTLLMQEVLADPKWAGKLTNADRRALSPLFRTHVNPYGRFELDMNSRLDLDLSTRPALPGPRPLRGRQQAPRRDTAGSRLAGARGETTLPRTPVQTSLTLSTEPLRGRWRLYALTPAAGWGWC